LVDLKFIILSIAALGFYGATRLSIEEWGTAGSCPNIGVPACYLVAIAYFMILISCIDHSKKLYKGFFYTGVGVVMGLAIGGSVMQVTGMGDCPKTGSGFPMCYVSLMMSLSIAIAYFFKTRQSTHLAN
jgi:hypothetical protein